MKARARREARAETSSGPIWASEEATAGVGRPGRAVAADHLVEGGLGQPAGGRAVAVEEVSHASQGARHVFRRGFTVANSR